MQPLRLGMIGTGYMARKHLAILSAHPLAQLAVVCCTERSQAVGDEFCREFGFSRRTTHVEELLEDPSLDLVFVCSPDNTHAHYAGLLLEAGKHVFCEKPLALELADFHRLRRAQEHSGKVLQVGMNCRYRDQFSRPQRLVTAGEMGPLRFLRGVYLYNSVDRCRKREKEWWFQHPYETYFFLHGNGVHCIDLLQWIGGPVRSVFARASGFELGSDFKADTFSVSLQFESGALGELLVSAGAFVPRDFSLELWLDGGSIRDTTLFRRSGDTVDETPVSLPVEQPVLDLGMQYTDLVRSIREQAPMMNDLAEAYENYCIIHAIERSVREGQPVGVNPE